MLSTITTLLKLLGEADILGMDRKEAFVWPVEGGSDSAWKGQQVKGGTDDSWAGSWETRWGEGILWERIV